MCECGATILGGENTAAPAGNDQSGGSGGGGSDSAVSLGGGGAGTGSGGGSIPGGDVGVSGGGGGGGGGGNESSGGGGDDLPTWAPTFVSSLAPWISFGPTWSGGSKLLRWHFSLSSPPGHDVAKYDDLALYYVRVQVGNSFVFNGFVKPGTTVEDIRGFEMSPGSTITMRATCSGEFLSRESQYQTGTVTAPPAT